MGQQLKILFLFICTIMGARITHAQDKIFKTSGSNIEAKVTTVENKIIHYITPDGHKHGILKKDIAYIIYQNGSKDVFNIVDTAVVIDVPEPVRQPAKTEKPDNIYGKNIFAVTTAYSQSSDRTINDPGMGISFERLLGRRGFISINIPVMICFSATKDYYNSVVQSNNGQYYSIGGAPANYVGTYSACYLTPGVKLYLLRDSRRVRYSIGASFMAVLGGEPVGVRSAGYSNAGFSATYHYSMYGFMISNSLSIMASKHLLIALDLGIGIPETDNRYINSNTDNPETVLSTFIQGGLKIGYRY